MKNLPKEENGGLYRCQGGLQPISRDGIRKSISGGIGSQEAGPEIAAIENILIETGCIVPPDRSSHGAIWPRNGTIR